MQLAATTTNAFFSGVWVIIWIVVAVLVIAGLWKTLEKAGKPGGERSSPSTTRT